MSGKNKFNSFTLAQQSFEHSRSPVDGSWHHKKIFYCRGPQSSLQIQKKSKRL